jgi:hypothetical protein
MKYRIWCEVWGGVTGSREAWMTKDNKILEFDDKKEADKEASECNRTMGRNSPASFRYTVKEI